MKLKQITCVLFLFSLLFITPDYSYGQIGKGNKIIGGNFGLSYHNSNSEMYNSNSGNFRVSPSFGYFITDRSLIGISPSISYSVFSSTFEPESTRYWGLGTELFFRRFFKVSEKFQFYLEPNVGYHRSDRDQYRDRNFHVSLSPGLAYLVSGKFWLEAKFGGISYLQTQWGPDGQFNTRQYISAGITSYSSIGLFFILK
ncbi:MAG TPA: outer membrane beta-barrel protein [Anditalea sp.]|nr:outer membrane beta-barrel protein [Anditalea sp.]